MVDNVEDIQFIKLPHFPDLKGSLIVMEGKKQIPFNIARVFLVKAPEAAIRGKHAHKACTQFLVCLQGAMEIRCDDGTKVKTYVLDRMNEGVLIPPGIWDECFYRTADALLLVLCDRPYEEQDYIRDYNEFKSYRAATSKGNKA